MRKRVVSVMTTRLHANKTAGSYHALIALRLIWDGTAAAVAQGFAGSLDW